MADGRRNNGGHSTKGKAGRKSKAEEMGLPGLIQDVIGDEGRRELIEVMHAQAKKGSFQHMQLLMAYDAGKPTEYKEINLNSNVQVQWGDEDETT